MVGIFVNGALIIPSSFARLCRVSCAAAECRGLMSTEYRGSPPQKLRNKKHPPESRINFASGNRKEESFLGIEALTGFTAHGPDALPKRVGIHSPASEGNITDGPPTRQDTMG